MATKEMDFDIHTLIELKEVFTKLRKEMWYSADAVIIDDKIKIINDNIEQETKRLDNLMLDQESNARQRGIPVIEYHRY